MKQLLRSFNSFTRAERTGIVALCIVIMVLLGVRIYMNYLPAKTINTADNQELDKAYTNFLASQPRQDTVEQEYADRGDIDAPLPDIININTADSATLVRLKGIGPAFARKIITERKIAPFTSVDELLKVQHIPQATWQIIKPHLSVNDTATRNK